jgi:hypothetical protein
MNDALDVSLKRLVDGKTIATNMKDEPLRWKLHPSFPEPIAQPVPVVTRRRACLLIVRFFDRSVIGIYSAEEVKISVFSLVPTCTFL